MNEKHTNHQISEFKIKDNIFSAADTSFGITNCATNTVAFNVAGKSANSEKSELLTEPTTISDVDGNELFRMRKLVVSRRKAMYIDDATANETVYSIRRINFLSCWNGAGIWKGEGFKDKPAFEIRGSVTKKDFSIFDKSTGQVAAVISKNPPNESHVLIGRENVFVRANPGYDEALMLFLAILVQHHGMHDSSTPWCCSSTKKKKIVQHDSENIFCIWVGLEMALAGLCLCLF